MGNTGHVNWVRFVVLFLGIDLMCGTLARYLRAVANHPARPALWFLVFVFVCLPSMAAVTDITGYLRMVVLGMLFLSIQLLAVFLCCMTMVFLLVSMSHPVIAVRSIRTKVVRHWGRSLARATNT